MELFEVQAKTRTEQGKGASRRLRHANLVPAIVYGADKDAVSITLEHNEIYHHLENEAFYSHVLSLVVDGKAEQVVLKDLQRHPAKNRITHADFLRVSAKQKLTMAVPVHLTNEEACPGKKLGGGVISHLMTEIEVSCLPGDLPEFIEVDLSTLELGEFIMLSDVAMPDGVEATMLSHGGDDQPVVSVQVTRAAVESDDAEAVADEGDAAAASDEGSEG